MIALARRVASADRASEDFYIHLVSAGLAANLAQPTLREVDDFLLVPETGVDLPSCYEHRYSLLCFRIGSILKPSVIHPAPRPRFAGVILPPRARLPPRRRKARELAAPHM